MKKFILLLMTGLFLLIGTVSAGSGSLEIKAEEVEEEEDEVRLEDMYPEWDFSREIELTEGVYTYHAYAAKNQSEAWIYRIDMEKKSKRLVIPDSIEGKAVTRLGAPDRDVYGDLQNIFRRGSGIFERGDSNNWEFDYIQELILPETVKVIQPAAFCGMDGIETVKIPDQIEELGEQTFCACDKLKKVILPANLKELDRLAFYGNTKLTRLELSPDNTTYTVDGRCVIRKKDKTLIYVLPGKSKLNIPKGTKRIQNWAFNTCNAVAVHIPASVVEIENHAFQEGAYKGKIEDVTVSKKNKVYAKDGQCIYDKRNKSLVIGIADDNRCLRISEKVWNLKPGYSIVHRKGYLRKVIFPKSLKTASKPAFIGFHTYRVYFLGEKPPVIKIEKKYKKMYDMEGSEAFPTCKIYVPEKSNALYKKMYKKYKCYHFVDQWGVFDPETKTERILDYPGKI